MFGVATFGCQQKFEINENYVREKIQFLAADELKGRKVFTDEIDLAADYIAREYRQAGLEQFAGTNDFKQSFALNEVEVYQHSLTINGQKLSQHEFAAQLDEKEIDWSNDSDVIVTYIRAEDDFFEEFNRFRRNDDNLLVIVDPAHEANYKRYAGFLSRPARRTNLGEGRSLVMALSDIDSVESYSYKATAVVKTKELANVVGWIPGKRTDEFVVFSGHYDHIGVIEPNDEGDSIANGANDDASGTVAVMALARYFASRPQPERSLIFVAFTAEEVGGYGSRYFSKQLNPQQIVAMFNIEMIGKPAANGPNTAWITGFDKSDFGQILQESVAGTTYKFYADPYPEQNLFYRSDNATLARLGVPAHSISTTPIDVDEDYHQVSDEVETLDLLHLTNTIKAIEAGGYLIVSGVKTPSRVDPTGLR